MITSHEEWLGEYTKNKHNIWIIVNTEDLTYYLPNHKDWLAFVKLCNESKFTIKSVGLRYRSHSIEIDISDYQGAYVIRSLLGIIGENSRETITIGKLKDGIVYKTLWVTPELIEQIKTEDPIEECFEEALAINHGQARAI